MDFNSRLNLIHERMDKSSPFNSLHETESIKLNQEIEKILLIKYKLVTLGELALKFLPCNTTKLCSSERTNNVGKYLIETTKLDDIHHKELGTLQQYIFYDSKETRKNLKQFVKNKEKTDDMAMRCAIETFMVEFEYVAHEDGLKTNDSNVDSKQELAQSTKIQGSEEKKQDGTLKQEKWYWDKNIHKDFQSHLDSRGIKAKCCRELLAYEYNVNIRVYGIDEHNKFTLKHDHNSCADKKVHLLQRNGAFVQLKVDEDYWKLDMARRHLDQTYKMVLDNMKTFVSTEQVDSYAPGSISCDDYDDVDDDDDVKDNDNDDEQVDSFSSGNMSCDDNDDDDDDDNDDDDDDDNNLAVQVTGQQSGEQDQMKEYTGDGDKIAPQALSNYFGEQDQERDDGGNSANGDKSVAQAIASYFTALEQNEMKAKLSKLTLEYTRQHGILENILLRFSCEGKHVSYNEMCFFVNSVLSHRLSDGKERYTFAWIVAAYPQSSWIDELILLKLESYFKKQLKEKQAWREYLSKISNKEVLIAFGAKIGRSDCSVDRIGGILQLLSSIPLESISLNQINLSEWFYVLKEYYWTFMLKPLAEWNTDDGDLLTASYYMISLENIYAQNAVLPSKLLKGIKSNPEQIAPVALLNVLSNFHTRKWLLAENDLCLLERSRWEEWIAAMQVKYAPCLEDQTITQLVAQLKVSADKKSFIFACLPQIENSLQNISGKQYSDRVKKANDLLEGDIKKCAQDLPQLMMSLTTEEKLTVIDRAIELKREFTLRNTQRLAVLALLQNNRSTLAQVSTGEGKSLIVVTVALMKALAGETVDIFTSSSVLAKRDVELNEDIYSLFGVKVSHNCEEDVEWRKDAYSLHQVVYGDLASFQRDFLLDRFYGKNILGNRNFSVALVDEVDSMLIDKGNNMLYLSHDIPGLDKLESVYLAIWQMVNTISEDPDEELVQEIKDKVLQNLYQMVNDADIQALDRGMTYEKARRIRRSLVKGGIIDEDGKILTATVDDIREKLKETNAPELVMYRDRLAFLLTTCIREEKAIHVPNFLKPFVERHLEAWIMSAINALFKIPGQSYVVGSDKSGAFADRNANIVILDSDTGTDQQSSQWDEALHQFLQLKHGCKLSMQSLKAVFISNVTYFKKYKLLYGLTGTLGSEPERRLLQEEHSVDFVTIPTAKSKQFEEYESIVCCDEEKWKESILNEVNKMTDELQRSVLIICETINDAESMCLVFRGRNVHLYTRDYQNFVVADGSKALAQKQIIIATNLAGRGTDIRISNELRQAGGLHVILSYLPANRRIEEQAFGRAARCGDKGSGRMIVMVPGEEATHLKSKIFEVKMKRDTHEIGRLSVVKRYYETTIRTEEECFEKFRGVYEKNKQRLEKAEMPKEIIDVLMQSCLDRWAVWLDENSALLGQVGNQFTKQYVEGLLENLLSELSSLLVGDEELPTFTLFGQDVLKIVVMDCNCWIPWVERNPYQMVKLAKLFMKIVRNEIPGKYRNFEDAWSKLFRNVIETEPFFCEAAYYYSTCALLNDNVDKAKKRLVKKNLKEARKLYERHRVLAMQAVSIVESLKGFLSWSNGYNEQKMAVAQIYYNFQNSIDNMLGHAITPQSFVNGVLDGIDDHVAERIFEDLTTAGIVTKPKVRKTVYEDQLHNIQQSYGVSAVALKEFLAKRTGPIDEENFIADCQRVFPLPSREEFWEILVVQQVLVNEKHFVIVDRKRLKVVDPSLLMFIEEMVNKQKLTKETIIPGKNQVILRYEQFDKPDNGLIKPVTNEKYAEAKKELEDSIVNSENDIKVPHPQEIVAQEETAAKDKENTAQEYSPPADENSVEKLQNKEQHETTVKIANGSEYIFGKEEFSAFVGEKMYNILKKNKIISFNKMADVDNSKIESCELASFNSIRVEDIVNKTNICKGEAELIIAELLEQNVIERKGDAFALKISFIDEGQTLLPSYPVYESIISGLIDQCFTYKFALRDLEAQIKKSCTPTFDFAHDGLNMPSVKLKLPLHPHNLFFVDLVAQDIIRPPISKGTVYDTTLEKIYNPNMHRSCWQDRLQNVLSFSTNDAVKLVDTLIKDQLLQKTNLKTKFQIIKTAITAPIPDQLGAKDQQSRTIYESIDSIKNITNTFCINDLKNEQNNLIFHKHADVDCKLSYDSGKTVEKYLQFLNLLSKEESIKHIDTVLKNSKPCLKTFKKGKVRLNFIRGSSKENNFDQIEEERLFILNGLEHFVELEEKKWTICMMLNTMGAVVIGLTQMTVAAFIEVISCGLMTHVASGLFSEGIGDLNFCLNSIKTGYFSWKDYAKHKINSLGLTILTTGFVAIFSRGVKYCRAARKYFGLGLKKEGVELAAKPFVGKACAYIGKRVLSGAAQGLANGAMSLVVDDMVDKYMQSSINAVASQLLSEMVASVDNHSVCNNLEKLYYAQGKVKTTSLVNEITSNQLKNNWEGYLLHMNSIFSSVSEGVGKAMQTAENACKIKKNVTRLNHIVTCFEKIGQIALLRHTTNTLFDKIDKELATKLEKLRKEDINEEASQDSDKQKADYARFKKDITDAWKEQLCEHVGRVMAQHLVKPLINMARSKAVPSIIKAIKVAILMREIKRAKKTYNKKMSRSGLKQENKEQLRHEYEKELLSILHKSKSSSLFADIIREGVMMDMTCVVACAPMLQAFLKKMGITKKLVRINVHCENTVEQTFTHGKKNANASDTLHIELDLKNNHFTLVGSQADPSEISEAEMKDTGNNCLYYQLCKVMPELKAMGPDGFRNNVANFIERDANVRYRIRQGWHRYPIKHANAIGGRQKQIDDDIDSDTVSKLKSDNIKTRCRGTKTYFEVPHLTEFTAEQNIPEIVDMEEHLINRGTNKLFEVAKLCREVMNETGLEFKEIFCKRGSNIYDNLPPPSHHRYNQVHRAHKTRLRVKVRALKKHSGARKKIMLVVGQREYVNKSANEAGGPGAWIDKMTYPIMEKMVAIVDFDKPFSENVDNVKVITNMISSNFRARMEKKKNKYDFGKMDKICKEIENYDAKEWFDKQ